MPHDTTSKQLLSAARNRVMQKLAALNEPCSGCRRQLRPAEGEFHHYPWRVGHTRSLGLQVRLYSIYNGVRVCHQCHTMEGREFQETCARVILTRIGSMDSWWLDFGNRMVDFGMDASALPDTWPRGGRVAIE